MPVCYVRVKAPLTSRTGQTGPTRLTEKGHKKTRKGLLRVKSSQRERVIIFSIPFRINFLRFTTHNGIINRFALDF